MSLGTPQSTQLDSLDLGLQLISQMLNVTWAFGYGQRLLQLFSESYES
jgi:hypothetical protein